jgi:single-strand DNA-binding protein
VTVELPLDHTNVLSQLRRASLGVRVVNLVVVQGLVREDPVVRSLSSGQQAISFELAVRSSDEALESVPVVSFDAACVVVPDDEVVVVGRVRKRFFRVGGLTQSRTEVVAARVVPARRRAQVAKALDRAIEELSAGA